MPDLGLYYWKIGTAFVLAEVENTIPQSPDLLGRKIVQSYEIFLAFLPEVKL